MRHDPIRLHSLRDNFREDHGGISPFIAILVLPLLALIGILVVDGGGKIRAVEHANAVAREAARAGGQAIDPASAIEGEGLRADPAAATAAASAYLRSAGQPGTVSISADGTVITVTINSSYDTKFLTVIGIGSLSVSGEGQATLLQGVTAPN